MTSQEYTARCGEARGLGFVPVDEAAEATGIYPKAIERILNVPLAAALAGEMPPVRYTFIPRDYDEAWWQCLWIHIADLKDALSEEGE